MPSPFEQQLIDEISQDGSMPFERFVERALYHPERGFYSTSGKAGGRRGDFITSVETGPLFAAVIGDWLDQVWHELGQPDEFRVAEAGAGVGTLFRGLNRSQPACFGALTYMLVEQSVSMRSAHESLPTDRWRTAAELPSQRQHVILANELLDNLPFGIAERVGEGWAPVHVGVDSDALALTPASPDPALAHISGLAVDAAPGDRVPIAAVAKAWVEHACSISDRLLIFDYAATTAELASRGQDGWLRTYAQHTRGHDPLADFGQRDITHDVAIDQLPPATNQSTQAEWLNLNGLPARVDAARKIWHERAHIGDLQAIAARSAVIEADALLDPTGLGAFVVLEWHNK